MGSSVRAIRPAAGWGDDGAPMRKSVELLTFRSPAKAGVQPNKELDPRLRGDTKKAPEGAFSYLRRPSLAIKSL